MNEFKKFEVEDVELAQFKVHNIRSKICLAGENFGVEVTLSEKVVSIGTTVGCHIPQEEEGSLKVYKIVLRHVVGGWMVARTVGELYNTRQAKYV
jgi:hypothetical protein